MCVWIRGGWWRRGGLIKILLDQSGKVHLLNDLDDKAGKIPFGQPVLHGRRQETTGLAVGVDKMGHYSPRILNINNYISIRNPRKPARQAVITYLLLQSNIFYNLN
jgi:hypothetical protein